jgi:hypothetical protein
VGTVRRFGREIYKQPHDAYACSVCGIYYAKIIIHRLNAAEVEGTEFVKQTASDDVHIGLSTC